MSVRWRVCVMFMVLGCLACALACEPEEPKKNPPTTTLPHDLCKADTTPDKDCYASKRDPQSASVKLALEIAKHQIASHSADSLKWDWGEAVMMHGIYELYRVTQDKALLDYIQSWIDTHIDKGYKITTSDSCAPTNSALALWLEGSGEKYKKVVDDALDYLYNKAIRTEDGGLNHLGTIDSPLTGVSLWLDSLFMFGNLLVRYGEHKGDEKALSEYASQFKLFTKKLQQDSGLYLHAHGWPGKMDTDIFWARGNAWVTAATFEYLRVRMLQGKPDAEILAAIKRQVDGALKVQDKESGLWWSVMNRPGEIYLETSASALFAYAMARGYRYGFLDKSVLGPIKRAIDGVTKAIKRDGDGNPIITGISGPTNVGTFDMYAEVKQGDDISYGVGAVILALLETAGLPVE